MNSPVEKAEKFRVNVGPTPILSTKLWSRPDSPESDGGSTPGAGASGAGPRLGGAPLRLRLFPDDALREMAHPVKHFGEEVSQLAGDMLSLMHSYHAIGLTAPQVGSAVRIFVADIGEGPMCLVNPEFAELAMRVRDLEGCLSLPGVTREVKRAALIEVWGYDETGRSLHFEARGLLARLIQHEVDHLDGVLIIDPERGEAPRAPGPWPWSADGNGADNPRCDSRAAELSAGLLPSHPPTPFTHRNRSLAVAAGVGDSGTGSGRLPGQRPRTNPSVRYPARDRTLPFD